MHFSITITLGLHFLLYLQRVSSSLQSILENHPSSVEEAEDILGIFFTEFNEILQVRRIPYRQLAVIGAPIAKLRQMRSLLNSQPYIICTDPEICDYPKFFKTGSIFVSFVKDFGEKTLETNLKIMSGCNTDCRIMFVFDGIEKDNDKVTSFLVRILQGGTVERELLHVEKDAIRFYRIIIHRDCTLTLKLFFVWRPGTEVSKMNSALLSEEKTDLLGCQMPIGTVPSSPKMVLDEKKNGLITVVGGKEGNLVLLIAELLNFTPVIKLPSPPKRGNESIKDSLMEEVATGIFRFGIARLGPTNRTNEKIEFSKSYDEECLTWAVPRRMSNFDNLVWAEFPGKVWALIAAVFIIGCAMWFTLHNRNLLGNRNRRSVGFAATVLEILAINLQIPFIYLPISKGGRLLIVFYLFYAMVVTTAYRTSLAAILATERPSPLIDDVKGIIEANFNIGGTMYNFNIYKNQGNASEYDSEVLKRYEVIHNNFEVMRRLRSDSNFACLGRRGAFQWEKQNAILSQKSITFDVFSSCILTYSSVIVFPEGSYIRKPIDRIIYRAIEAGILKHWERDDYISNQILERVNSHNPSQERINQKFNYVFILYFYCLLMCLLVFFIELITAKLRPKKRQRIVPRGL